MVQSTDCLVSNPSVSAFSLCGLRSLAYPGLHLLTCKMGAMMMPTWIAHHCLPRAQHCTWLATGVWQILLDECDKDQHPCEGLSTQSPPPSRLRYIVPVLTHLNLANTLKGGYNCHSHFGDGELRDRGSDLQRVPPPVSGRRDSDAGSPAPGRLYHVTICLKRSLCCSFIIHNKGPGDFLISDVQPLELCET